MSKYGNRPATADDVTFDSRAERNRYLQLRQMEADGLIADLKLQPTFELQPPFTDRNGKKHRAIFYKADFQYTEQGATVIEDVKGYRVKEYRMKMKMLLFHFRDIDFREIQV